MASKFTRQGVSIVVIAVLARLLFPEDFGLIALAVFFTGLVGRIGVGFRFPIIQRSEITQSHLVTMFWTGIVVSAGLWGISSAAAPFLGAVLDNDRLSLILIAMFGGLMLDSIGFVPAGLLNRNLRFKHLAIVEFGGALTGGIASISLAYAGLGVWSLVWGGHIGRLMTNALLWSFCAWRPALRFSFESLRELRGFGSAVVGNSGVNYIGNELDKLIVGSLLGARLLGFFSQASRLTQIPRAEISQAVSLVTFPVFSGIQNETGKLRYGFLKTLTYTSLLSFPLLVGLAVTAPEFVSVIYGERWADMVVPLQVLCAAGIVLSVATNVGPVAFAKGRADLLLKLNLLKVPLVIGALYLGGRDGLVEMAVTVSVFFTFWTVFVQVVINRMIGLSTANFLRSLYPAALGSIVMALVLVSVRGYLVRSLELPDLAVLIALVLTGAVIYLVTLIIGRVPELSEGRKLVADLFTQRS